MDENAKQAGGETGPDVDLVSRVGPLELDWPRSIGYFGGVGLAVAAGLIEPPLGVFIAAVPFLKMLDLPAFSQSLAAWLDTRRNWRPNVLNFSRNLLEDLRPRAITRDLDWGVKVPLDGWRDAPMKRFYVWFADFAPVPTLRRFGAVIEEFE